MTRFIRQKVRQQKHENSEQINSWKTATKLPSTSIVIQLVYLILVFSVVVPCNGFLVTSPSSGCSSQAMRYEPFYQVNFIQRIRRCNDLTNKSLFNPPAQHRRSLQSLFMATSSKTGGHLIESVEDYNEFVLQQTNQNMQQQQQNSPNQQQQLPVLVFWTAPWCGPCRLSIPVVKDIMKQFATQIKIAEVCTDDLPDVASDAGVVSIPTIHIYYNGQLVDTIIGCVAKTVLASAVTKVLEDVALMKK